MIWGRVFFSTTRGLKKFVKKSAADCAARKTFEVGELLTKRRKPDREGGELSSRVSHRFTQINADQNFSYPCKSVFVCGCLVSRVALPYGRASDTLRGG